MAVSSGEITVNPFRKIIYALIERYINGFVTNASAFDEFIAMKLRDGKSRIVSSIDAGTPETFLEIKGINAFDKVVRNLARYAKIGKVELKYIVLPGINTNDKDYRGVVDLCRKLGLDELSVSADLRLNEMGDAIYPLDDIAQFVRFIRTNGIKEFNLQNSLPKAQYEKLYAMLKEEK
jgi:molybdenum cofactor biosynthesis enzyme MoaA